MDGSVAEQTGGRKGKWMDIDDRNMCEWVYR